MYVTSPVRNTRVDMPEVVKTVLVAYTPAEMFVLVDGVEDGKKTKRGKIRFLRRLPRDPMHPDSSVDPAQTWGLRSYASDAGEPREGADVYDVYSRSPQIGLNGVAYKAW